MAAEEGVELCMEEIAEESLRGLEPERPAPRPRPHSHRDGDVSAPVTVYPDGEEVPSTSARSDGEWVPLEEVRTLTLTPTRLEEVPVPRAKSPA